MRKLITLAVTAMVLAMVSPADAAPAKADLYVGVTEDADPVRDDVPSTKYYVVLGSYGPAIATGVSVSMSLTNGAFLAGATDAGTCSHSGSTMTCSMSSLAQGGVQGITVDAEILEAGTMTLTASVSAKQPDPYRANNQAAETTTITTCGFTCPRLSFTDFPDPVRAGELIVYHIQTDVWDPYLIGTTVTFMVPRAAEYLGGCAYRDRTVTCRGDSDQDARVILRPLVEGPLTITATLSTYNGSSTAQATTQVLRAAGPGADTPVGHADTVEQQSEDTQYQADQIKALAERLLDEDTIDSHIEFLKAVVCRLNPFCRL